MSPVSLADRARIGSSSTLEKKPKSSDEIETKNVTLPGHLEPGRPQIGRRAQVALEAAYQYSFETARQRNGYRQRALFAVLLNRSRVAGVYMPNQSSAKLVLRGPIRSRVGRLATKQGATCHAERSAVQSILSGLRATSMFIFQLDRDGNPQCALPCEDCSKILFAHGLAGYLGLKVYAYDRNSSFVKLNGLSFCGLPSSADRPWAKQLSPRVI